MLDSTQTTVHFQDRQRNFVTSLGTVFSVSTTVLQGLEGKGCDQTSITLLSDEPAKLTVSYK